jgi:peptidoglycan/LPS O-acetylase OafA/YrhL
LLLPSEKSEDDDDNAKNYEGGSPYRGMIKTINYSFMDGIRGIGALVVYHSHFFDQFIPYDAKDKRQCPEVLRKTPLKIIYSGYFFVVVFFILSGFVLPLRYFKTGKETCLTGGTFRRYLRLMIPVLMIQSIYFLFMKLGAMSDNTFMRI